MPRDGEADELLAETSRWLDRSLATLEEHHVALRQLQDTVQQLSRALEERRDQPSEAASPPVAWRLLAEPLTAEEPVPVIEEYVVNAERAARAVDDEAAQAAAQAEEAQIERDRAAREAESIAEQEHRATERAQALRARLEQLEHETARLHSEEHHLQQREEESRRSELLDQLRDLDAQRERLRAELAAAEDQLAQVQHDRAAAMAALDRAASAAAEAAVRAERAHAQQDARQAELHQLRQLRNFLVHEGPEASQLLASLRERSQTRAGSHRRSEPSVRDVLLRILGVFSCLLSTGELTSLATLFGLHERRLTTRRFGPLRRDEVRAYRSARRRPVWLAAGIWVDGTAVTHLWGRSDWPLAERVVAENSEEPRLLRVAARACEQALEQPPGVGLRNWALGACERAGLITSSDVAGWRTEQYLDHCLQSAHEALRDQPARGDEHQRHEMAHRLHQELHPAELVFGTDVWARSERHS